RRGHGGPRPARGSGGSPASDRGRRGRPAGRRRAPAGCRRAPGHRGRNGPPAGDAGRQRPAGHRTADQASDPDHRRLRRPAHGRLREGGPGRSQPDRYRGVTRMPQIIFLPHAEHCPEGAVIEASPGETVLDAAPRSGIDIEQGWGKSWACTTCHVVVREGFESLEESDELEDDMLDKAWGLEPTSRLSCQAVVADQDLVVEIPKYTINQVSEGH